MDEHRARKLLEALSRREVAVVLVGNGELRGSDIDLLVLPEAEDSLIAALRSFDLGPRRGDAGHTIWTDGRGGLDVDVLVASHWPPYYPSLEEVLGRLERQDGLPPLVSAEDRVLMLLADSVGGRSLSKVDARAQHLLADAGVAERVRFLADREGMGGLADRLLVPGSLAALSVRGRLPYPVAFRLAFRSVRARAALRARLVRRLNRELGRVGARAPVAGRSRGYVITLSGIDGSGKSTAAQVIKDQLEAAGLPAQVTWGRLGQGQGALNDLAQLVKGLLGRRGAVADPVAAGGPAVRRAQAPDSASGRRQVIAWGWIVLVAGTRAASSRRATRPRRSGTTMICDRWLVDSLVDLEVRYGRHRAAELVLRLLLPRADLAILLELSPQEAARRKPGDQAPHILARLAGLYGAAADRYRLTRVNAAAAPPEVARELAAAVDTLLARQGGPQRPGGADVAAG